jgi:hypothetical protein
MFSFLCLVLKSHCESQLSFIYSSTGILCKFAELQGIAKRMVDTFYKNLSLSNDLDPQESMYGEELLSMASSILVQVCSSIWLTTVRKSCINLFSFTSQKVLLNLSSVSASHAEFM